MVSVKVYRRKYRVQYRDVCFSATVSSEHADVVVPGVEHDVIRLPVDVVV